MRHAARSVETCGYVQVSIVYDEQGTGYLFYTAVGPKGRGIALLTSKPMQ